MSGTTSAALPDGYKAPAALVDEDHHGAWIHICTAFGLIVVLISLGIRVYIRTKVSPPFKYDDITLTLATMLSVIQAGVVFEEVSNGFGTSMRLLSGRALLQVQKLGYAADLLYILTIYTSKASVVLLFKRISADRLHDLVAWGILGACIVFGFISFMLTALRCELSHPWLVYGSECSTLQAQSTAIAALDIITELMLFSISLLLVWELHTAVKNKSRVVFAFGIRLPVVAVIVLRLVYLRKELNADDPTLTGAIPAVLTQLEIFYGIMAATVPCLRPFLAGFATHYGAMGRDTVIGGSQVGTSSRKDHSGSQNDSLPLSTISSIRAKRQSRTSVLREKFAPRSRSRDIVSDMQEDSFQPGRTGVETTVTVTRGGGYDWRSIGSDSSTRMIIKKQVQVHVGSDNGTSPIGDAVGDGEGRR